MNLQRPEAAAAHAREFWGRRYQTFSLSESGWMGAGERYNGYLYECKRQALLRGLRGTGAATDAAIDVLDAGCGQGFFAGVWRHTFPRARYTGVDICEKVVAHLTATCAGQEFFAGDLATWRHPQGKRFDVIHSFEVLHLLLSEAAVEQAVCNLAAQLKPGGHLLLTAALPETATEPNEYIRHPARKFWDAAFARAGLRWVATDRIYYWLPDGGPKHRVANKLLRLPGPWLLFALDRCGRALNLPQWFGGWDSRTKLLTLKKL